MYSQISMVDENHNNNNTTTIVNNMENQPISSPPSSSSSSSLYHAYHSPPTTTTTTTSNNNNNNNSLVVNQQELAATVPQQQSTSTSYIIISIQKYWKSNDCTECIICIIFGIVCFILAELTDVYTTQRPIPYQLLDNSNDYVRNLSYNELFNNETIPDSLLIVVAIIIPLCIQLLISCCCCGRRGGGRRSGGDNDIHCTICIYIVALSLTQFITDIIKMYCGYLRPIFYTICQPNDTYDTCTNNNNETTDSSESYRRSFPSGHASTSFCGLTLLSLYIHTKFGIPYIKRQLLLSSLSSSLLHNNNNNNGSTTTTIVPTALSPQQLQLLLYNNNNNNIDQRNNTNNKVILLHRIISIIALVPMGIACFIASSRVVDNKHFPADITAGAMIGTFIAYYIHYLWYY